MRFVTWMKSFLYLNVCLFNSVLVRRGAGLQASAGASERWGLWRRPVELWKLHLPQPPCTQPLWTVWDATLHLKLALRCIAHPCPILRKSLDTMSPNPIESVLRSSPVSQYIPLICWGRATILPLLTRPYLVSYFCALWSVFFGGWRLLSWQISVSGHDTLQLWHWVGQASERSKQCKDWREGATVYRAKIPLRYEWLPCLHCGNSWTQRGGTSTLTQDLWQQNIEGNVIQVVTNAKCRLYTVSGSVLELISLKEH